MVVVVVIIIIIIIIIIIKVLPGHAVKLYRWRRVIDSQALAAVRQENIAPVPIVIGGGWVHHRAGLVVLWEEMK